MRFDLSFVSSPFLLFFFSFFEKTIAPRGGIEFNLNFVNALSIIHTHPSLSRRLLLLSPFFFSFYEINTLPRGVESNFGSVKFRFEKKIR